MLRRILLPLDPSLYAMTALEYATGLALQYDADITALGVLDIPGIESTVGATPIGAMHFSRELYEQRQAEAYEHMHGMIEEARNRCESHHVHYTVM